MHCYRRVGSTDSRSNRALAGKVAVPETRAAAHALRCRQRARHKYISAAGYVYDIPVLPAVILEQAPQRRDVDSEVTVLHHHLSPHSHHQFLALHDRSGVADEHGQNIEGSATDLYGPTLFRKQAPCGDELKLSKSENVFVPPLPEAGTRSPLCGLHSACLNAPEVAAHGTFSPASR